MENSCSSSAMIDLNEYCLRDVFKNLPFKQKLLYREVCQKWRNVLSDFLGQERSLVAVRRSYHGDIFNIVNKSGIKNIDHDLPLLSVEEIEPHNRRWEENILRTAINLLSNFVNLQDLVLDCQDYTFSDSLGAAISRSCPILSSVAIMHAFPVDGLSRVSTLKRVVLIDSFFSSEDAFAYFIESLDEPQLLTVKRSKDYLKFSSDFELTPRVVNLIKTSFVRFRLDTPFIGPGICDCLTSHQGVSRLVELELPDITRAHLRKICQNMPYLRKLHFSGGFLDLHWLSLLSKLNELGFSCQGLVTESEEQTLSQVLGSLKQLEALYIKFPRFNKILLDVVLSRCENLKLLSLQSASRELLEANRSQELKAKLSKLQKFEFQALTL